MRRTPLLFLLGLGIAGGRNALAQEAPNQPDWAGAPDCRFAPVHPAPARQPAWDGMCKAGFAEGKGRLAWQDAGGRRYTLDATMAAGQPAGPVTLRFPDDSVYIGTVKEAIPDGQGYFRDAKGFQYEGEIRMGQRSGIGEAVYANGDGYKGGWNKGRREGSGVQTYMLGGRYEGGWKDNKPSGEGKIVYAGSPAREVAVIDGRPPEKAAATVTRARYELKEDQASTGTNLRRPVATNIPVPPELGYEALSEEQRATVRSWYPALAPGDEPPYPVHGPAAFYQTTQRIVSMTRQRGSIHVYVRVGKDGKVVDVTGIGLDNPEVRKAVATAAGLLKYKPAVCAGAPCEMMYPYSLALTMGQ